MDAADSPAPQRRWWLRIVATFLAAALLYVLSAGPLLALLTYRAARLSQVKSDRWGEAYNVIYRPLYFCILETPLQTPFESYIQWWAMAGADFARSQGYEFPAPPF
jgi:hypothetical protein